MAELVRDGEPLSLDSRRAVVQDPPAGTVVWIPQQRAFKAKGVEPLQLCNRPDAFAERSLGEYPPHVLKIDSGQVRVIVVCAKYGDEVARRRKGRGHLWSHFFLSSGGCVSENKILNMSWTRCLSA